MVSGLAKCQQRLGGKYLSAFPTTWFDRLDKGERVWAPFYTIHKIMAGLFDMHRLTANTQALDVLERMSVWTDEWTASKSEAHMQQILTNEFGGMAERSTISPRRPATIAGPKWVIASRRRAS
jgi:DUF1680 family protein